MHLELLPSLETDEFFKSFKTFIARRGRPKLVYSDNGGTFVGAASWLRQVYMNDEKINGYLARQGKRSKDGLTLVAHHGGAACSSD
jgi:hypothetical protein